MSTFFARATWLRASVFSIVVGSLSVSPVWAATDAQRIAELEKKLAASTAQIEQLAARLLALEQVKTAQPGAAPAAQNSAGTAPQPSLARPNPTSQDGRLDTIERNFAQLADSSARLDSNAGAALHGFTDVGYASSSKPVSDTRRSGFVLGNVDFYLTPDLGGRIKSLIELNFEYGESGVLATELERMQIGYTVNDQLTLWLGRFHTPFGYWNTAYHHGAQIQTSVLRPKMLAFEDDGGIVPNHTVGLWANGMLPLGAGKLEYDLYVGNGGRIVDGTLEFNNVKDDNANKMVGASLRYRFADAYDGLIVGLHGFGEQVDASFPVGEVQRTRVGVLGAYGYYDANDWDVIGEYYHFNNKDLGGNGARHASWSGFVQIGRTFGADLTPYVRFEKASLDQLDNYFLSRRSARSYTRQAVGLRYDLAPKAALKMEFNRTDETRDGGSSYHEAQLQYAIRF